jgi:hypothetical protein
LVPGWCSSALKVAPAVFKLSIVFLIPAVAFFFFTEKKNGNAKHSALLAKSYRLIISQ